MAICAALLVAMAGGWFGYHQYALRKQKRAAAGQASAAADPAARTNTELSSSSAGLANLSAARPTGDASDSPSRATDTTAAAPVAPVAAPPASDTLKLKIEASKRTELKVVGDGKILFKGRLHSDDPKSFEARDGFELTADDASVVQVELNDRSIPFASMAGRHRSMSIGRKDLKPPSEPSH
jgi:hypothetical protein